MSDFPVSTTSQTKYPMELFELCHPHKRFETTLPTKLIFQLLTFRELLIWDAEVNIMN